MLGLHVSVYSLSLSRPRSLCRSLTLPVSHRQPLFQSLTLYLSLSRPLSSSPPPLLLTDCLVSPGPVCLVFNIDASRIIKMPMSASGMLCAFEGLFNLCIFSIGHTHTRLRATLKFGLCFVRQVYLCSHLLGPLVRHARHSQLWQSDGPSV